MSDTAPLDGEILRFTWKGDASAVTGDGKLWTWSPQSSRWANAFTTDQAFAARRLLAEEVSALRGDERSESHEPEGGG